MLNTLKVWAIFPFPTWWSFWVSTAGSAHHIPMRVGVLIPSQCWIPPNRNLGLVSTLLDLCILEPILQGNGWDVHGIIGSPAFWGRSVAATPHILPVRLVAEKSLPKNHLSMRVISCTLVDGIPGGFWLGIFTKNGRNDQPKLGRCGEHPVEIGNW